MDLIIVAKIRVLKRGPNPIRLKIIVKNTDDVEIDVDDINLFEARYCTSKAKNDINNKKREIFLKCYHQWVHNTRSFYKKTTIEK
jgi:hypothetical protein